MTDISSTWDPRTCAARAGIDRDTSHGSITPPLYLSSNFSFEGFEKKRVYDYTRSGNPSRDTLGQAIADLEGGYNAVVTSSGMAALDLVFQILKPDDLLIAPHDCYGGTHRLLQARAEQKHFRVQFVDLTQEKNYPAIGATKPKIILVETPSNPLLRLTDIGKIAQVAKRSGALLVADNTFLSPVLQKPLALGADIVVHSNTKYLNGHSDVVGGSVVSKTQELHDQFAWWANCIGTTGAPFDAFLTLRGIRTLELRVQQQSETAGEIAEFLEAHHAVALVNYPGLKTHPGHGIARQQQSGFGAMLSIELEGGVDSVRAFVNALQLFSLAESLGGFESLVAHPATMTHAAMDPQARREAGISDTLLRLSIGLETSKDLKADLTRALDAALAAGSAKSAESARVLASAA